MPRLLDLLISIILLIITSPVFVIISLIYFVNGWDRVIYRQNRIGKEQQIFKINKFRSLPNGKNRQHKFPFGKFMRNSSLDELPQLFNILKGDMALVGPRPLPEEYLPYFTEKQKKRFQVRPGVTGLAQISGRSNLDWDEKLKLDTHYVRNMSFRLDIKILVKTINVILFKRNQVVQEESFIEYNKRKI